MTAAICAFILTFSTLCGSRVVSGVLDKPRNVRLTSHNMNLVLRWDPPEGAVDGLVYTTEQKTTISDYRVVCLNISTSECDFSSRILSQWGKYTGRVRAQAGAESSPWVESNHIVPDKDTVIGSPSVSLISNGATIEVSISDPVFVISSLRNVYISDYNITYWKADEKEKARSISKIEQTQVVLDGLDPWTKYCVQVQINTNVISSEPSTTICESTTSDEEPPWLAAVVTFFVIAMVMSLVMVTVVYWKRISHVFFPKYMLPQHFKEYLLAPPKSSIYLAMRNSKPPEEIYHQVSIIADGKNLEEECPLEAGRTSCSRQPNVTVGQR